LSASAAASRRARPGGAGICGQADHAADLEHPSPERAAT
jgi:hypothetical protein